MYQIIQLSDKNFNLINNNGELFDNNNYIEILKFNISLYKINNEYILISKYGNSYFIGFNESTNSLIDIDDIKKYEFIIKFNFFRLVKNLGYDNYYIITEHGDIIINDSCSYLNLKNYYMTYFKKILRLIKLNNFMYDIKISQ
jgi:hypothetical protein